MKLSENEKRKFLAFRKSRFNVTLIAKKISRSKTVVNNFLKNPEEYGNIQVVHQNYSQGPSADCIENEKSSNLTRHQVPKKFKPH